MSHRRAVIVALHDLHRNSRILKQATTLCSAGFDVTAVGIVRRSSDPENEMTDFGRIVRVRTTERLFEEGLSDSAPRDPGVAARARGLAGVYAGARMALGRLRENLLLERAVLAQRPDVVIASNATSWIAGARAARRAGVPLVADARDLVADSGGFEPAIYLGMLRRTERSTVRRADAVTVVSPLMADTFGNRYGPHARVVVVYNGPLACSAEATSVGSPLRLFFQGHFARNRGIDELVRAAAALRGRVVLTLQGFGDLRGWLEQLADDMGAGECVRFIDPCPPDQVVQHAARHDIGVFWTNADTLNLRVSVPIKVMDYVAGGLGVVAPDLPGMRQFLADTECGVLVPMRDTVALESTLRSLAEDADEVLRLKHNAVRACPRYSWEAQGERFLEVVESVMERATDGL